MQPLEKKIKFVELRTQGKSFSSIAAELGISKSTCSQWERELGEEIATSKAAALEELYEKYFMGKRARIERYGKELQKIDEALSRVNYDSIDPAKLLDMKLKYAAALSSEYVGIYEAEPITGKPTAEKLAAALLDLLNRIRAQEVTNEQAQREAAVIASLLKAYETNELEKKIETLETILGERYD